MRLLERFSRFMAGLSLVLTYYVATLDEGGPVARMASLASVCAALMVFMASLRLRRHVRLPGAPWCALFLFSMFVATWVQGFRPVDLRRTATFAALLLNIPVLMQVCSGASDRRTLRAVLLAILAVTLFQVALQVTCWMPSLREILSAHPDVLLRSMGLDPLDDAAREDVSARVSGFEPFGHLVNSNNLAIVLLMMAALARCVGQRLLGWSALLVSLMCVSKGVILAMLAAAFIGRRRLRPTLWTLALCLASLLMWRQDVGERLLEWSRIPSMLSVEMRLSYWQTARTMTTWGPVGLGGYGDFAAQARPDGGHYSTQAHNAFLELCAEVGIVAAFAGMIWLSGLFRGTPSLVRETQPGNLAIFWGALSGFLVLLVLSDPFWPNPVTNPFSLAMSLSEREIVPAHPWMERLAKGLAIGLFALVGRGLLRKPWVVKPESLSFSACVFLLHLFIDTDLSHPGVMIVAFALASLGWERGSSPSTRTWLFLPVVALGTFWALEAGSNPAKQVTRDPAAIQAELTRMDALQPDMTKISALCRQWHDLEPANPAPIRRMVTLTDGEERRSWLESLSATEPANPRLHVEVATLLFQMGESPDLVLEHLKRARDIDALPSLDRYRLDEPSRKMSRHLWERLAPAGAN